MLIYYKKTLFFPICTDISGFCHSTPRQVPAWGRPGHVLYDDRMWWGLEASTSVHDNTSVWRTASRTFSSGPCIPSNPSSRSVLFSAELNSNSVASMSPWSVLTHLGHATQAEMSGKQKWAGGMKIFYNYGSRPNGLRVNSPWGRRLNDLLTHGPFRYFSEIHLCISSPLLTYTAWFVEVCKELVTLVTGPPGHAWLAAALPSGIVCADRARDRPSAVTTALCQPKKKTGRLLGS